MSDDFYYDDPVEDSSEPRRKAPMVLAMILLVVTGSFFLKTTFAANINLVSSNPIDFGQGMEFTTACSGTNPITVKPAASFVNASGGGAHYLTSVTVSGIPSTCNGKDFAISVFNAAGNTAVPLFTGTAGPISTAVVYSNSGTFQEGYQTAGATITSGSGTFTVTFPSPLALTSNIAKLTIQSGEHARWDCSMGAACSIGDIGPGGGTIFYVSAGFTEVGAPCNTSCHYLEWAPNTWGGGSSDLQVNRWSSDSQSTHQAQPNDVVGGNGDPSTNSGAFGQGFINTQRMLTSNGTTGYVADSSGAAYLASRFAGSDNSAGKWFLPSVQELYAARSSSVFSSGGFLTENGIASELV